MFSKNRDRLMDGSAEHFVPRRGRYRKGNESEFDGLWNEYGARFSIDFQCPPSGLHSSAPCRRSEIKLFMTVEKRIPSRRILWQLSSWVKRVISTRDEAGDVIRPGMRHSGETE